MPRRVDGNQRRIVKALRDMGATVQHLHTIGHGCPDLLVGFQGRNYVMELKMPKCGLTGDEEEWHLIWNGRVHTVYSVDDAIAVLTGGKE